MADADDHSWWERISYQDWSAKRPPLAVPPKEVREFLRWSDEAHAQQHFREVGMRRVVYR